MVSITDTCSKARELIRTFYHISHLDQIKSSGERKAIHLNCTNIFLLVLNKYFLL